MVDRRCADLDMDKCLYCQTKTSVLGFRTSGLGQGCLKDPAIGIHSYQMMIDAAVTRRIAWLRTLTPVKSSLLIQVKKGAW